MVPSAFSSGANSAGSVELKEDVTQIFSGFNRCISKKIWPFPQVLLCGDISVRVKEGQALSYNMCSSVVCCTYCDMLSSPTEPRSGPYRQKSLA